jgi:hypothetical protein
MRYPSVLLKIFELLRVKRDFELSYYYGFRASRMIYQIKRQCEKEVVDKLLHSIVAQKDVHLTRDGTSQGGIN